MLNLAGKQGARFCDGWTRRDFLRVGAVSTGSLGLSLADLNRLPGAGPARDIHCIVLFLVGGPSQLDTWDLKPSAPAHIRGPFRPIQTNVPGIQIGEHFPLMAKNADKFALIRSVHHPSAPIHETGHQMMQTGHLFRLGQEYPHYGSVVSHIKGPKKAGLPPFVVVPGPIGNTGVNVSHGQSAGFLGSGHEPIFVGADPASSGFRPGNITLPGGIDPARMRNRNDLIDAIDSAQRAFDADGQSRPQDPASERAFALLFSQKARRAFDIACENEDLRARYGRNTFGQSCLLARRLVEHGVRLVTVNMFDTVFNKITWDCHADGGALGVTLHDYRQTLCPMFDAAYTALLEDLRQRGMLERTLVVAMGEFGRTPQLNARGGRDHWPGVWSILFAGAGVRGGQVIGASDRIGSEPRDRPVSPAEVAASIYQALGIRRDIRIPGPGNRTLPLIEAEPVQELFRG